MERDYLSSLLNLFRKRISKIFVCLLIFVYSSCDFDSPSNFVVPTWFIDIKLPLVSKTFPMGNLVDTTNFIYPTDDSAGFQLILKGDIVKIYFENDLYDIKIIDAQGNVDLDSQYYKIKAKGESLYFLIDEEKLIIEGKNSLLITEDTKMFSDGEIEVNNLNGEFKLFGENSFLNIFFSNLYILIGLDI